MSNKLDLARLRELSDQVELAKDYSVFSPTEAQRRSKSNFWSHFAESGSLPPSSIELATALRYGGNRAISEWWDLPGFHDWFTNRDEFRQRIEFLADLALDQIYLLIKDPKANASARVTAMKMVMEMGRKISIPKPEASGDLISKMGRDELTKFIQDRMRYLPDTTSSSVPGDHSSVSENVMPVGIDKPE